MATQQERVDRLETLARDLQLLVDRSDGELDRVRDRVKQAEDRLLESERRVEQLRIKAAVLRRDADELRKAGDVWGARIWTVVVAVLAGGLGYYLKR